MTYSNGFKHNVDRIAAEKASEHNGPWIRPSGNLVRRLLVGYFEYADSAGSGPVEAHANLPADAIPLVPQTEVDAVKAELEQVAYWRGNTADRLTEAYSANAELRAELTEAKAMLEDLNAAPSLPAVDTPPALRYAADVIEQHWRTTFGQLDPEAARILRAKADRLEREQAEKAEQDKLIEQISDMLTGHIPSAGGDRAIAERLLAAFDIIPKEA